MDVNARSQALADRMAAQLRVRGSGSLADVADRAGRKLPKRLRSEVEAFTQAEALSAHPRLALQVDEKRLKKAEKKLDHFLGKQNPAGERRDEILDSVAKIAFVIFVIVLAAFFTLLYRGYF